MSKGMNKEIEVAKKNDKRYRNLRIDALALGDSDILFRDKEKTSLGFSIDISKSVFEFLCEKFQISNPEQFREKLCEAISGDGQELNKISALASSSLCALLCFYGINKDDRSFSFDGVTYTDVHFEVRNKVIRNPSNMDVVLVGKDEEGRDAILFIECKFSEFLGTGKYELGKTYKTEPYASLFKAAKYDEATVFQYGIKQLITHYWGIRNFIEEDPAKYQKAMAKYYAIDDDRKELYRSYERVSFLEVIFDFSEEADYRTYCAETENAFDALRKEDKGKEKQINLLGTTTYQQFFSGERGAVLDPKVKEFYRL